MRRRDFLAALALGTGAVLVPKFGRWHRQGSGLLVRDPVAGLTVTLEVASWEFGDKRWRRVAVPMMPDPFRPGHVTGTYEAAWASQVRVHAPAGFVHNPLHLTPGDTLTLTLTAPLSPGALS